MKNVALVLVVVMACSCGSESDSIDNKEFAQPAISGQYLGQPTPGNSPEIFAPGIISSGTDEMEIVFSADGRELFFAKPDRSHSIFTVVHMKQLEGVWSEPVIASFSGQYHDRHPEFSPDGNRLYFTSKRPLPGDIEPKDMDIWYVDRTEVGWSEPTRLGERFNTSNYERYPKFGPGGMYFERDVEGESGTSTILFAELVDNELQDPVPVDIPGFAGNAFYTAFDPEGRYMVFISTLEGGVGNNDMWITFREEADTWSAPINCGEVINTPGWENCPSISPDGKYLFYVSRVDQPRWYQEKFNYQQFLEVIEGPGNGGFDIFWMSTDYLLSLNPE